MTPEVLGLQAHVFAAGSEPTSEARNSQSNVLAGFQSNAQEARALQTQVLVTDDSRGKGVEVRQAPILVAVAGRTDDPAVRAWTFTLDGHDFYVLRLGTQETLVYDMLTEQWYQWGTGQTNLWNVYHGENWVDGNRQAAVSGSNVLVGSDGSGALWFLNPDSDTDDPSVGTVEDGREPAPFLRRVTAQVPVRGYDRASIYEVQLIGTTGELTDTTLTDITLSYSDDRGDNYISAGTVTIPAEDYDTRATWRSLGSFRQPGRLFRLEDEGALKRIDSFTMNSDLE